MVKLALFEGEYCFQPSSKGRSTFSDSPLDQKRSKKWDLGGSAMQLDQASVSYIYHFENFEPTLNMDAEELTLWMKGLYADATNLTVFVPKQSR